MLICFDTISHKNCQFNQLSIHAVEPIVVHNSHDGRAFFMADDRLENIEDCISDKTSSAFRVSSSWCDSSAFISNVFFATLHFLASTSAFCDYLFSYATAGVCWSLIAYNLQPSSWIDADNFYSREYLRIDLNGFCGDCKKKKKSWKVKRGREKIQN